MIFVGTSAVMLKTEEDFLSDIDPRGDWLYNDCFPDQSNAVCKFAGYHWKTNLRIVAYSTSSLTKLLYLSFVLQATYSINSNNI